MPKVIISYSNGSKATEPVIYDISETTLITFGKSESSTVVLDKTNDSFARHHCSIIYQGNNFYLRDDAPRRQKLTLINNEKIELSQKLFVDDKIRLGRKNSIEFTVDFDPRPLNAYITSSDVQVDDKKKWIKSVIKFLFG
jgi:pSer/pThr/pTyr-binding forkhead associated (FHA) protein